MNTLRENVADYLVMRRAMGFKAEGLAKLLMSFVGFCEARGVDHVTNDVALEWATAQIKVPVHDALFARRMDAVRLFARHQQALDPATQVPPETMCKPISRPGTAHLQRHRDPRAACSNGHVVPAVQGGDVENSDRSARRHRDAPG